MQKGSGDPNVIHILCAAEIRKTAWAAVFLKGLSSWATTRKFIAVQQEFSGSKDKIEES
ncbi:TPA: hypothetical protein I9Y37_001876 [Citrobacter freundii]|nr:hypothetical protein [Citrobacter freundii]HAT3963852.1 hypothetical protein [Citrobacter freundii]